MITVRGMPPVDNNEYSLHLILSHDGAEQDCVLYLIPTQDLELVKGCPAHVGVQMRLEEVLQLKRGIQAVLNSYERRRLANKAADYKDSDN